jgi:hypothetical protein
MNSRTSIRAGIASATLVAALGVAAVLPASAATVRQTGFANGQITFNLIRPDVNNTNSGNPVTQNNIRTGGFTGLLNGQAFLSYCIELLQTFHFNTNYTYSIVPVATAPNTHTATSVNPPPGMGAAKATDLARLLGGFFAGSFATTVKSAAMQLAIWEIVYETPGGSYDVSSGGFRVTGNLGSTQNAAVTQANNWLAVLSSQPMLPLEALTHRDRQDFITVVPLPPAALLFATALLGIWGVARRRRPAA